MSSFPGFEHLYMLEDPLSKRPLRGHEPPNNKKTG